MAFVMNLALFMHSLSFREPTYEMGQRGKEVRVYEKTRPQQKWGIQTSNDVHRKENASDAQTVKTIRKVIR